MSSIKIQISEKTRLKIEEIAKSFNNEPGELINVLHKTQEFLGYLPAEAQEVIAKEMHVSTAKVYGVVSFYSFFTMIPKGRYPVSICMGTACYVRGAERILDEFKSKLGLNVGETGADGLFSLACGLAPVVLVGEKVFGRLAADDVKGIVEEYKNASGTV